VANATLPSQGLPWVIGSCGPYYYSCSYSGLVVAPGATLTVNPGAVVKVEAAGAITVQGSLIAAGSTTSPAVFTSLKDDSVGGDTNGDGNGTLAARGDWGGLSTSNVGGSPRPKLTLSNTVVNWTGTAVTASGLADVSVTSSQVSHSSSTALQLSPTSGSAITVSGTTVDDAVGDGIAVMMDSSDGGSPTVSGNTVTHVTGVAVRIFGMALTPSQLLGNIGSSDGQAVLMVSGAITGDLTLPTAGLPWVVGTAYSYYGYYYCPSTCGLTVGPGATLTLGAGAVLKADHTPLFVQGSLVATGTAASPAVLTSYRDDAVGGDLNGDGNGSSPVAGDWLGVQLSQASGYPAAKLTLGHAVISYAVTAIGNDSGTVAKVAVANSAIQHSSSGAVSLAPARGSSVSFTADTVDDARGDGLSVLMDSTDATAYPTITGNAITHARGAAVHVSSRRLLPPQLAGNTGSADATTAIVAEGSLASDLTLPTSGLPWVIGQACGQPPLCGLTVSPGVTLTLQPGAVLKARPGATLAVQGSLIGAGTAAQPVTITSINDDTAGGDTNGDGDGSVPATGEWVGVVGSQAATWPAPTIQLGHATVSYAAVALTATSAATLTHSRLVGDAAGVVGPATVNGSCANGTVDATNTYWGDPSGPAPTGHGASVSGCVSYLPYATT
jgi:hypothetical protein